MPSKRILVVIGAAVAVAAVGFAVVATAAQNDPVIPIRDVVLGPVAPGALQPTAPSAPVQVPGLDELAGRLGIDGGGEKFRIGEVELDLGPPEWLRTAVPLADYDGDGRVAPLLEELNALVGTRVTALVRLDDDGDDADVYVLAGQPFRDPRGGSAPWQDEARPGSPTTAAPPATVAEVQRVAEAAIGPGARVVDIDREDDPGEAAWEVEVIDGREYEVELDAAGRVLRVRED